MTGKQPGDVIVVVSTAEEYVREALKKTVIGSRAIDQ